MSSVLRARSSERPINHSSWSSGRPEKMGSRSSSDFSAILDLAQVLMNELDRHRTFSHARSNALDRSMAHVAHGKDSGYVGFQQERVPFQVPSLGTLPIPQEIRSGEDESAFVALHQVGEPVC